MVDNDPMPLDEVIEKSGAELFREMLRIYSVAAVDDYWKGGKWQDQLMRSDLQILRHHRKEAGAPRPPELEDVSLPELPTGITLSGSAAAVVPKAAATWSAAAVVPPPPSDIKEMATFIARWKLDAAKTKAALVTISAEHRRQVIQHFKCPDGKEASAALAAYIAECQRTADWTGGAVGAADGASGSNDTEESAVADESAENAENLTTSVAEDSAADAADESANNVSADMDMEPLEKSGPELFRELRRVYGMAEVEDYYKGGRWLDDLMRTDIQILVPHRKEAGNTELPPIEDVQLPELPQASTAAPAANTGGGGAGGGVVLAPMAEMRQLAALVAKYQLDAAKAKGMFSKLSAWQRSAVIHNFQTKATGAEAVEALGRHIAECEKTGKWTTSSPATATQAATTLAVTPPRPAAGAPTPKVVMPASTVAPARKIAASQPLAIGAAVTTGTKRPIQIAASGSNAGGANGAPRTVPAESAPKRPRPANVGLPNGALASSGGWGASGASDAGKSAAQTQPTVVAARRTGPGFVPPPRGAGAAGAAAERAASVGPRVVAPASRGQASPMTSKVVAPASAPIGAAQVVAPASGPIGAAQVPIPPRRNAAASRQVSPKAARPVVVRPGQPATPMAVMAPQKSAPQLGQQAGQHVPPAQWTKQAGKGATPTVVRPPSRGDLAPNGVREPVRVAPRQW
eukprot:TRINITY_DN7622_c0_g1_i2.p1 TRINITY_DN7622_c0_g1~~TRINITY_DN7622_c0_g1_i2.p1  ORF type:complete len:718 (+),score=137.01 TRINITY_DN7622_c0_g1_i2:87-2156(+)